MVWNKGVGVSARGGGTAMQGGLSVSYLAQISRGPETWSVGGGLHDQPAFCLRSHERTVHGRENRWRCVWAQVNCNNGKSVMSELSNASGIQVKFV